MENILAGQSGASIISAFQALLPLLLEYWDDLEGFKKTTVPVLLLKMGMDGEQLERMEELAAQTHRQVIRLHHMQFRSASKMETLDAIYTRLVPSATDSSVRQGFLWLAFQAQKNVIEFMGSEDGKTALSNLKKVVDENKALILNLDTESDKLFLNTIEKILMVLAKKSGGEGLAGIRPYALAGNLLEWGRREARNPRDSDLLSSGGTLEEDRYLIPLLEPIRKAELNEAYQRFLRMNEQQKEKRFDILRKTLLKQIKKVARFAPKGFETFCMAVEALLFPYPSSIEWMRSYLKPIYTNAQQSSIFDNCLTVAAVTQRYEKMVEEKSANMIMLELSKAFALGKLNQLETPMEQDILVNMDLNKEFKWPKSVAELKDLGAVN